MCVVSSVNLPCLMDFEAASRLHRAQQSPFSTGIGKSVFGYLLLYYWATEDPPREVVVVKRGYRTKATLLTTAGCFELDANALAEQLRRPEVRYVFSWTFCTR